MNFSCAKHVSPPWIQRSQLFLQRWVCGKMVFLSREDPTTPCHPHPHGKRGPKWIWAFKWTSNMPLGLTVYLGASLGFSCSWKISKNKPILVSKTHRILFHCNLSHCFYSLPLFFCCLKMHKEYPWRFKYALSKSTISLQKAEINGEFCKHDSKAETLFY